MRPNSFVLEIRQYQQYASEFFCPRNQTIPENYKENVI